RLNKTQVAERRRQVSEKANSGWTQQAIAAALNASQATVCRDLEVFNAELRQETVHNVTEVRNRQLYKLELVEAEAWAGGFSSPFEKHDMATARQSEFSPQSQLGGAEGDGQTPPVPPAPPPEILYTNTF
ncbi:MAG: hypothetical protein HY290_06900, partial [Planctomycetia bacterium]|nr:hypothetical protein [Planctomycetia bacterium]